MTPEQARADERAKVVAWRPIASAPLDGSTIVAAQEGGSVKDAFVTWWIAECGRWANNPWGSIEPTAWFALPKIAVRDDAIERGDHHKEQGE